MIEQLETENKRLADLYRADGPFIYELFACLIHQGHAMAGHYFAYIYDRETQKWFNFDDYRVN